jgi:hypothetical protein
MASVDGNGNGVIDFVDTVTSAQTVVVDNCNWVTLDWGGMNSGDERSVSCGNNEFISAMNYTYYASSNIANKYISDIYCCS